MKNTPLLSALLLLGALDAQAKGYVYDCEQYPAHMAYEGQYAQCAGESEVCAFVGSKRSCD